MTDAGVVGGRHDGPAPAAEHRTRRAARTPEVERDNRRVAVLKALGPDSRYYVEFGLALRDFAMNTLLAQWRDKTLLVEVRRKTSIPLGLPPSYWDFSHIRSIVAVAVSRSVEPFLDHAVLHGGWNPDRGATISTFFTHYCYYRFADEYRREYRSERRSARTLSSAGDERVPDLGLDVARYLMLSPDPDPERVALDRAEIRRLLEAASHSQIPTIVFLVSEGHTAKEIGRHLNMSDNAVNKALGKFRADVAGVLGGTR
jgi:DNA-directed RNA polymerase specialized sigma24 family protein